MFSRSFRKPLSTILFLVSLLLIVSSCGSSGSTGKSQGSSTSSLSLTPQTQVTPICHGSSCVVPTSVVNARPFIDTWDNIHLLQSFDYHIQDPASIAKYYDFIWGAATNKVAAYRATNPDITLSYYISFFRDSGAFGNSTSPQSLSYWQNAHPDWILYRCDRTTPAYEDGEPNIPFNFANPAVVQWQVQTYALPASQNGYDAIAADNVNLENMIGACGYYKNGQWVQRYSGRTNDPQWRADILAWVTQMQQALHALSHPLLLVPNLGIGSIPLSDPTLVQIVQHVDAVLDEGGFTGYGENYLTDSRWAQKIQFIENVQQQGKAYYIVNEFNQSALAGDGSLTSADIEWVLASYLMCKQHTASVFLSPTQDYGRNLWNTWYAAQIGSPRNDMYQGQGVYWRDYTHGMSIVNPSSTATYTVKLPGQYTDLNGNSVGQTITLPPRSGAVLLF